MSQPSSSAIGARVHGLREFFALRDAEAQSKKLPAEVRESIARDVVIARQKREAAEVLWLGAGPAEALALARDALERVANAVERAHEAGAAPALPSAAAELRTEVAKQPLPVVDADVAAADNTRFQAMIATHDELRSLVEPSVLSPSELAQRRRTRIAWAVGVAGALIVAGYFVGRTPRTLKAEASAVYDDAHNAAKSVDGRSETEWLLPNKQLGWIDFTVLPARKVKRLKLLNGHNPPHNDRQTKDYHLEVYGAGGKVLKTLDGSFGETFNSAPTSVTIDLNTSEKVERIRFEVKSFHITGAALAEVEAE